MAVTFVRPRDWKLVPPNERNARSTSKLNGMEVSEENPFLLLLEEPPHTYTPVHSHSEPEVMVVLEGEITFNGELCEQGSIILISANEDYWHSTGAERCVLGLLRPTVKGGITYTKEAVYEAARPREGRAPG